MHDKKYQTAIRFVAVVMVIILITPVNVFASIDVPTPRASDYLSSYNTYLYRSGLGKIQVWFTVTGVGYMDEIGALTVRIYESSDQETWTWVKTYTHESTTGMLDYNDYYYASHVEYKGTIGKYYKAYVTIWAGKDGKGDTRYMWTDIQKATLLAG